MNLYLIYKKKSVVCKQLLVLQPASVVKLVDTPDLGSGAARFESSSLSARTIPDFEGMNLLKFEREINECYRIKV